MKRILLILLAAVIVLGFFAAVGYTGYRFGYARGAQVGADGDGFGVRSFDELGPRGMWIHDFGFGRGLLRGHGRDGFPMIGLGFFSPLVLLGRIVVLALLLGLLYWLFSLRGWRLTRITPVPATPSPPTETEARE